MTEGSAVCVWLAVRELLGVKVGVPERGGVSLDEGLRRGGRRGMGGGAGVGGGGALASEADVGERGARSHLAPIESVAVAVWLLVLCALWLAAADFECERVWLLEGEGEAR